MTDIEKASLDELEARAKVKRAEKRLEDLATDFTKVVEELSNSSDVNDAVKIMARFVARVNNSKAVIRKSQE